MNATTAVLRLQLVRRGTWFVVPLVIVGITAVVTLVIQLAIQRALGVPPDAAEWIEGARGTAVLQWGLSGYLVSLGVASVASVFPVAGALGTTRRDFTTGTLLTHVLASAYVTAVLVALLGLELLTGHWFLGVYVLDTTLLGSGNAAVLMVVTFLGSLTALTIGSAFGAVWLRFGPRGPLAVSAAVVLVLAVALLAAAPQLADLARAFQAWWLVVVAGAVVALASVGTAASLRRAASR